MSENTRALITNNLISIAVHICMCIAFIFPLLFLYRVGSWGGDIFIWVAVGLYTTIALFLYFLAGKSLLHNMQNVPENAFSVIGLSVILAVSVYAAYGISWESLLRMPVYPIGGAIFYISQIEEKHCYLALSLLPSLMMLAGLMAKRQENTPPVFNMGRQKLFFIFLIVLLGLISFLVMFLIGMSAFESFFVFLIMFLILFCFNVTFLNKHPFFYVFFKNTMLTKTLRMSFLLYLSILFSFLSIIIADILFSQIDLSFIAVDNPIFSELLKLFVSAVLDVAFLVILKILFLNSAHRQIHLFDPK